MRIGLKFCGGCNPYYKRGETVQELVKKFPQFRFEIVRESEYYDIVLLVCGCIRGCIEYYCGALTNRYIVLRSPEDFNSLISEMGSWEE